MTILRIAGWALVVAALAFVAWAVIDRFDLADRITGYEACASAADKPDAPLTACDAKVAARVEAARRADACDAAIGAADLYVVRATCTANVKTLAADRDAARSDLADTRHQLDAADRDRDAAVTRAEARRTTHTTRTTKNDHVIAAAPLGVDGRSHCDAACLRALAGDAAPDAP